MSRDYIPAGLHTVTPHIVVDGANAWLDFVRDVFGGEVVERHASPDEPERLMHGKVRIGDATIECGDANPPQWSAFPAQFHCYFPDADAVFARAVAAGATVTYPVTQHPYGERSGGVVDRWGNHWFIATATR